MIDIEALSVGDVVQLMSGGPYMTVQGFREVSSAGPGRSLKSTRTHVCVVLWGERIGFVKEKFAAEELRYPRPRETPPAPSAAEPETAK